MHEAYLLLILLVEAFHTVYFNYNLQAVVVVLDPSSPSRISTLTFSSMRAEDAALKKQLGSA